MAMCRTLHRAGLPVQASSRPVFAVLVIAAQSRPGTAGAHLVLPPPCFPVLLPGIADTRHGLARPNKRGCVGQQCLASRWGG